MKNYTSKHAATLSTRGFYTILTLCGLIIAASAWVIFGTLGQQSPEEVPSVTTPIIAPTEALPDLTADTPVVAEAPVESESADGAATETAPETTTVAAVSPVYVRPTSGAVVTPFSGDELLFQPTFGDWRVHTGTDFAAEPGEPVLALTRGEVLAVYGDPLYGTSVTVSHDADLTTTYCGLDAVRVAAGQAIDAGETIGTCAEQIAAETAQGVHVHVEAKRGGTAVDVLELLDAFPAE